MKPCNELEIVGLDATYRKYYLKGYEDAEKEHNYHLKKIRAEIEQLDFDFGDFYDHTSTIREMVLEVIDKYNAERSEE